MIIIVLLSLTVFILTYHCYIHHGKNGKLINLIPGPPISLLLGNILDWQGPYDSLWSVMRSLHKNYYPIYRVWALHVPVIAISHPDDMKVILNSTKHIEKSQIYEILHPWFGTGLLTSGGAKWHSRRKILTPAFHFNILREFVHVLVKEGEHMIKCLKNEDGEVVKDLLPFISEHTLNAICETAMGTSLQDLGTFQGKYFQAVQEMGQIAVHRLTRPWLCDMIFQFTPLGWKQTKILKVLHGFTDKIIVKRKLYHERTEGRYLNVFTNSMPLEAFDEDIMKTQRKRLAMLDILIAESRANRMSDQDIREEVDTFIFEGHDTTAAAICFSLMLLAEHKDIQERVRIEVNSLMEETDEQLNISSLQKLPYLDRCLKETLRLYPSVHAISRVTAEDTKLQSYLVPTGTILHLDIYDLHRDPNFWPNPEVFDPDRFLPEITKNHYPYSYLPFSAGPRNCIGQRFAMLELKAFIVPLLYNFHLEPVDSLKNIRIIPDLVIRPAHPLRVKFIPIKRT